MSAGPPAWTSIHVSDEIPLSDGGRLVEIWPRTGGRTFKEGWPSVYSANHNVLRLDAAGNVIWQIKRDDKGHINWDYLNAEAKAEDPQTEGYFDPFWNMALDERHAPAPQPAGVYRPGCKVYLTTRWWGYELDVETGVATCTGEQIK